ncbi:hypothetical protein CAOG_00238 [Capsaspora owczarzaki ATCC 30864]|uniref:protein-tyrosine-phosphatase n=1 Tax=Capsaspora owczarzaki (strain ATCC 30864) TaxID=595528 RepID=A0A0D2WI75_CAPO3|nr:hypothetical protein CAOG_00238 [Capsaspora owczarzaki ATCC 30864]KJE88608.1 hypothetical protein CAOG_000238 [Capsaspora owczarzaki ATCC 30864]|eukprot:XP_004365109.1 hypothetical protein CAOG_00238 [Capsaspora owczarzaki ATCC 30864]
MHLITAGLWLGDILDFSMVRFSTLTRDPSLIAPNYCQVTHVLSMTKVDAQIAPVLETYPSAAGPGEHPLIADYRKASDFAAQRSAAGKKGSGSRGAADVTNPSNPSGIVRTRPVTHKQCVIQDTESEDLLRVIPECVGFIHEALRANANGVAENVVFVHCAAGVSRSASIVLAYLAYTSFSSAEPLTYDRALKIIQQARPIARPNLGFEAQLRVFIASRGKVDRSTPDYKWQALRMVHMENIEEEPFDIVIDRYLVHVALQNREKLGHLPDADADDFFVRCKHCNHRLCSALAMIGHGLGSLPVELASPVSSDHRGTAACEYLFVEPQDWMRKTEASQEGPTHLLCPRCSATIGDVDWQDGLVCACEHLVRPGIAFRRDQLAHIPRALYPSAEQ